MSPDQCPFAHKLPSWRFVTLIVACIGALVYWSPNQPGTEFSSWLAPLYALAAIALVVWRASNDARWLIWSASFFFAAGFLRISFFGFLFVTEDTTGTGVSQNILILTLFWFFTKTQRERCSAA